MRKLYSVLALLMVCATLLTLPVSAATTNWINIEDKVPVTNYDYSFAVVGDTQCLTYMDACNGSNYLSTVYGWIADNVEEKKIQYVFGLGDITDQDWLESTGKKEWEIAKEAISQLDGKVAYSMVRGNHDNEKYFKETFNYPAYTDQFDGFYTKPINTWREIVIGEIPYLMLCLEHGANDKVLKWANAIIEEHPNHRVIISTHWYLSGNGKPGTKENYGSAQPFIVNHGDQLWKKLVSKHKNIFMVLSGHYGVTDPVITQKVGENGNRVTQILVDPQGYDINVEPVGMVMMLYFSSNGKTVKVEYFSTIKNQYFKESNQKNINIPKYFPPEPETETTVIEIPTTEATEPPTEELTTLPETQAPEEAGGCGAAVTPASVVVTVLLTGAFAAVGKKRKPKKP